MFEVTTPTVSAVGHEVDVVLTDLVADVRAPTPTAAAALVAPDTAALARGVADASRRLLRAQRGHLRELAYRIQGLAGRLEALSPVAVLSRGYALALRAADGALVTDARDLAPGDAVQVRLARGAFDAAVTGLRED